MTSAFASGAMTTQHHHKFLKNEEMESAELTYRTHARYIETCWMGCCCCMGCNLVLVLKVVPVHCKVK